MKVTPLSATVNTKKKDHYNNYPGKSITEVFDNGFFTVDHKWMVKSWNKAAEKLLGVQAKDIVGKNLWGKFVGILPVKFYAFYHKAFLQDIPVHFEEYWEEKGAWFEVITCYNDNTLSVSFQNKSQPTFPEQPELRLRILNELYRYVTEVTNDCLWEWDIQNRQVFWIDGGHKRVFGYPIENALIPQSFWEVLMHPDDRVRIFTRLNKIIEEGSVNVWEDEYRFKSSTGKYAYVHDRGHIIYEEGKAARMIGATQDITARKSAETKLLEIETKLLNERLTWQEQITGAVLMAQETERSDIGMELHDNLNQVLGAAKLYVELAKTDKANRAMCLERSSDYLVTVMDEIRKISKTLTTPGMRLMNLHENIKILLDDMRILHEVQFEYHEWDIDIDRMDEKLQLNIFRIVQEQINNIIKHSKATNAIIQLIRIDNEINLLISDNGIGYMPVNNKKGIGIINIKNRAELYRGNVLIVSKPGEGFQLKIVLPFVVKGSSEMLPVF
jgi:PAS domain S-box-containing protein